MIEKAKLLFNKHRELVLYVFFGGLTTLVNIVVYTLFAGFPEGFPLFQGYAPILTGSGANVASTVIAWIVSVLFAYVTNRVWVFKSEASGFAALVRESAAFFTARLLSGLLDVGIMFVCVDLMNMDRLLIKIASNILVIIINYIVSKFWIFNNK